MKVTKDYLRKLIRETMRRQSQPMNEVEGQKIFFIGVRDAYESDMVYGVFDNQEAAFQALETLKNDPEASEYEKEGYQVWSYQITNKLSPNIINPRSLEDVN